MPVTIDVAEERDPLVSLIIIAWRSAPHLRACLESVVAHLSDIAYEIVLILNEPDAELQRFVDLETAGLRTITTRVNVGYGGAVNLGVRRARGEYIVLLNDDAVIMEDWLGPLVDLARRRPKAAAVGSTTLFPDGSIQEAGSIIWADGSTVKVGRHLPGDSRRYDYERQVDHCSGTSLLVRRSSWMAIGGMDEDRFYPAYYEDTDLCLRLIAAGEQVWYQPRSYVRHLESASTNSSYRRFLFEKNQAVFVERWAERLAAHVAFDPLDAGATERAIWLAMGAPIRVLAVVEGASTVLDQLVALQLDGRCQVAVFAERAQTEGGSLSALGIGPVQSADRRSLEDHLVQHALPVELVVDLRRRETQWGDTVDTGRFPATTFARASSEAGDELVLLVDAGPGEHERVRYLDIVSRIDRARNSRAMRGA